MIGTRMASLTGLEDSSSQDETSNERLRIVDLQFHFLCGTYLCKLASSYALSHCISVGMSANLDNIP